MDMHTGRRDVADETGRGQAANRARPRRAEPIEPLMALCAGARSVEAVAGDALRRSHPRLGATHAYVLVQLALSGEACRSDLQTRLALPGSSVGDALRKLVAEGLVKRSRGSDARRSPARLTADGARAAETVREELRQVAQRLDRTRRAAPAKAGSPLAPYASGAALRLATRETATAQAG